MSVWVVRTGCALAFLWAAKYLWEMRHVIALSGAFIFCVILGIIAAILWCSFVHSIYALRFISAFVIGIPIVFLVGLELVSSRPFATDKLIDLLFAGITVILFPVVLICVMWKDVACRTFYNVGKKYKSGLSDLKPP